MCDLKDVKKINNYFSLTRLWGETICFVGFFIIMRVCGEEKVYLLDLLPIQTHNFFVGADVLEQKARAIRSNGLISRKRGVNHTIRGRITSI